MADKKTVDKVKDLLSGHVYGPLKEAAEKWLAEADEKYGDKFDELKEKGSETLDKLGEVAEKYSDKSIEVTEKLAKVSDKISEGADKLSEKAAPVVDSLKQKAAPTIEELKGKAAPVVDKVTENEFIKQLKAGISSLDEVIETFSKPEMKEAMGEEAAAQIKAHAEAMKAEGKTFCDCPACTKAREILKDLGVDLEEPEVEAAAEEPEVTEQFESLNQRMTAAVYVYGGFLSAENPALDAGMCFYAANFFYWTQDAACCTILRGRFQKTASEAVRVRYPASKILKPKEKSINEKQRSKSSEDHSGRCYSCPLRGSHNGFCADILRPGAGQNS